MSISEKVILETKDGIKLLEDKLVYRDSKEYFIKDMKQASLKETRLIGGYYLLIEFKNGDSKKFYFKHTISQKEAFISAFSAKTRAPGVEVYWTTMRDVLAIVLEWATNINTLIDAQV
jgi:hypothetical protein